MPVLLIDSIAGRLKAIRPGLERYAPLLVLTMLELTQAFLLPRRVPEVVDAIMARPDYQELEGLQGEVREELRGLMFDLGGNCVLPHSPDRSPSSMALTVSRNCLEIIDRIHDGQGECPLMAHFLVGTVISLTPAVERYWRSQLGEWFVFRPDFVAYLGCSRKLREATVNRVNECLSRGRHSSEQLDRLIDLSDRLRRISTSIPRRIADCRHLSPEQLVRFYDMTTPAYRLRVLGNPGCPPELVAEAARKIKDPRRLIKAIMNPGCPKEVVVALSLDPDESISRAAARALKTRFGDDGKGGM